MVKVYEDFVRVTDTNEDDLNDGNHGIDTNTSEATQSKNNKFTFSNN